MTQGISDQIEKLRRAIEQNPSDPEAHYNLGFLLYNQTCYNEAAEEFQEAIRLKPTHARAHSYIGAAFYYTGNKKEGEAREYLERALRLYERTGRPEYVTYTRNILDGLPE